VREAKAQSAKRKGWLPKPPAGFCWLVCQLPGNVYEIALVKGKEYTKGYLHGDHGRIRWWWSGRQAIREFERFKQKSVSADEFVRRERLRTEMRLKRNELN
jgi:hypothetical protein